MPTALDLITNSLKTINAYGPGEDISASDAADALYLLNEMLDSWSLNGLYVFSTLQSNISSTIGQQTYTVGTGGNLNIVRPPQINSVNFIYQGVSYQMNAITLEDFSNIPVKSTTGIPYEYNYEPSMPLGVLSLYPTPAVVGTIAIQSPQPLTQFGGLNVNVDLPPGYLEALRMGLALKLCDSWGKNITPSMQINYNKAMKRIRRNNVVVPTLEVDVPAYVSSGETYGLNS